MAAEESKTVKPRLIINCTEEYHGLVNAWAKEAGFDSYANYIKYCINQQRAMMAMSNPLAAKKE